MLQQPSFYSTISGQSCTGWPRFTSIVPQRTTSQASSAAVWSRQLVVTLFGKSTGVVFEMVEGQLSILADLDEIAVGIAHIAAPLPNEIVFMHSEGYFL
jgi:hypothetical protein